MNVVPDTSVVVDGRVSDGVDDGTYEDATVYVPRIVVDELESQANRGKETGWDGLDELERLVDRADDDRIELEYVDRRPDGSAYHGPNDLVIRSIATDYDGQLLTSDVVQSRVAEVTGVSVEYTTPKTRESERLSIEEFFDDRTLSVHLKADVRRWPSAEMSARCITSRFASQSRRRRSSKAHTRNSSGCERAC